MKKQIRIVMIVACILLLGLLFFGFLSFNSYTPPDESTLPEGSILENPVGITLEVTDANSSSLTLRITQSGGTQTGELQYGSGFWIEMLNEDGEWEALKPKENTAFTLVAYPIKLDSKLERDVNFEWLYGQLENGTYRFCMEVMDFRGTGDYTVYPCYTEFAVK